MPAAPRPTRRKLSVPMVARMLRVADQKILHWIHSGELKSTNLARSTKGRPRFAIDIVDLEKFEAGRQVLPDGGEATTPKLRRLAPGTVREYF